MESPTCGYVTPDMYKGSRSISDRSAAVRAGPKTARRPDLAAAAYARARGHARLDFVLPHWLYWSGLLVFPLIAMYLVRGSARRAAAPVAVHRVPVLAHGGFSGIHRFYLRSGRGSFIPLFAVSILRQRADARGARRRVAHVAALERAQTQRRIASRRARGGDRKRMRIEAARAAGSRSERQESRPPRRYATVERRARWARSCSRSWLLVDAVLLPRLVRDSAERERGARRYRAGRGPPDRVAERTGEDPTLPVHTRFTDWIESINVQGGELRRLVAVIAVFVYYYECSRASSSIRRPTGCTRACS
jgi:hypothetical protein